VPTKYQGFYTRLGPRGKSRSLQGPLESTKKQKKNKNKKQKKQQQQKKMG